MLVLGRYLAIKLVQCLKPLIFVCRFTSAEIDAQGTVVGGAARLWCTIKNIGAPGDFKIDEAGLSYNYLELCFQQSTSNSASPEVYLVFSALGDGLLNQYISYL